MTDTTFPALPVLPCRYCGKKISILAAVQELGKALRVTETAFSTHARDKASESMLSRFIEDERVSLHTYLQFFSHFSYPSRMPDYQGWDVITSTLPSSKATQFLIPLIAPLPSG